MHFKRLQNHKIIALPNKLETGSLENLGSHLWVITMIKA